MKIIIAGGGVGGLTVALCARHFGHAVTLLERARQLDEVGAGIQIPPNAMKVFAALGLADALAAIGFRPQAMEARMGRSGRQLFHIPLAEAALQRWGAPYLHIHRADYLAVLAKALRAQSPDAVRLGAEVIGYTQSARHVTAKLADGTAIKGDVLLGGDGLRSPLRGQMLGAQQPIFSGNVAWRAVVPIEKLGDAAPPPTACVWLGAGRHCVTYHLRRGALVNFVGVVARDKQPAENPRGAAEEALADFDGWHETIRRVLREAKQLYHWALFDSAPLAAWVDGRVALLGDAAHPMLPFMAQGAAMAVEDAWVVTQSLSSGQPIEQALQAYQARRYARTSHVQARARANAKIFHKRTRLGQIATYAPLYLLGKIAPTAIHARQDWLYGYDVTSA